MFTLFYYANTIQHTMKIHKLQNSINKLQSTSEIKSFLYDLCTPSELKALEERWIVAQYLYEGKLSYREISDKVGSSTTTVTRVARFLFNEKNKGYEKLLKRILKNEK